MLRLDRGALTEIKFDFEGTTIHAVKGDTVAAALLAAQHRNFRDTPVSGTKRGPLCMMGVCFDCLLEIDGIANVQACMTQARAGMQVMRQRGANDIIGTTP